MTELESLPESSARARSEPSRRLAQLWLGLTFVVGLGYLALIPPFQAVDEVAHWDRLWSVMQGDYNCKKIPASAADFVQLTFRFDIPPHHGPVAFSVFDEGWKQVGRAGSFWVATNGCHYPPIGYLPAALFARIFMPGSPDEPAAHQSFVVLYGARLANWLWFFGCLVAALRASRYPMPVLVFASIPMVIHQAVSLNNDSFQFGALLVACALMTQVATRRSAWIAIGLITLASAIKPINVIAATLVWISLWAARGTDRFDARELYATAAAAVVMPVAAWLGWNATMAPPALGITTPMVVGNVDSQAQLALMLEQPIRFFVVLAMQLTQLFTAPPIDGGWRGIVLALGWYRHVAPDLVYWLALLALATGLPLLRYGARDDAPRPAVPWLLTAAAVGAMVAFFATATLVLWLNFTPVNHHTVFGVQGRYFLYPIGMAFFLYPMARRGAALPDGVARPLSAAFFGLSLIANGAALYAMRLLFWEA